MDTVSTAPEYALTGALPSGPATGFVGRAREIGELTDLLSVDRPAPLWVTGYSGVGKTTLITHVARQLLESGRYGQVVYTSLGRTGMPEAVLYDLGQQSFGMGYKLSTGSLSQFESALSDVPALMIWDDADAVLYGGAVAFDQPVLVSWFLTANRLATVGRSALCVLSDGPEPPPAARRLAGMQSYSVGMLTDADALAYAQALDERYAANADAWARLVQWLGGHPLALRCLHSAAAESSLEQVAESLLERAPGIASGEARFRNRALDMALDGLTGKVASPLSEHLVDLALFAGGFVGNLGPETMGLTREVWSECATPLIQAGLIWEEPMEPLKIPWVAMHPALLRWSAQRLTSQRRSELNGERNARYMGYVNWLMRSAARLRDAGPRLFYRELGNIRLSYYGLLDSEQVAEAFSFLPAYTALLRELGFAAEVAYVAETLGRASRALMPEEGPWSRAGVELALKQSEELYASRDIKQAGALLSQVAVRMEKPDGLDYGGREADEDHVRTLVALARVLRASDHADVAVRSLNDALTLLKPADTSVATRLQRSQIHSELLELHLQLGEPGKAAEDGDQALAALEGLDADSMRSALHVRRAYVALRSNDSEGARSHLGQAAEIMSATHDLAGLASVETQLSGLALRPPADLQAAMGHLAKAASYAQESGQWPTEAQLHTQMAQLALQGGSAELCEEHLQTVVLIYEGQNAAGSLMLARASLAEFYLQSGRVEEAQTQAELALPGEEPPSQPVPWELYALLQRIAAARSDEAAVARWRAASLAAYLGSAQAQAALPHWESLIDALVRTASGEALDTEAADRLEAMEKDPRSRELAHSLWRVLSGEREEALYSRLEPGAALVVHTLLERLAGGDQAEAASDTE